VSSNVRCNSLPFSTPLVVNDIPTTPVITGSGTQICPNTTVVLTGPGGFSTYTWSNGLRGQSIIVSSAGDYSLTVSNGNCTSPTSAPYAVSGSGLPTLNVGNDTTVTLQEPALQLTNNAGGTWSGTGVTPSGLFDQKVVGIGTYKLIYTVTSGICQAKDSLNVTVTEGPILFKNTFTPNGDGLNDEWEFSSLLYRYPTSLRLYNRYGVQLLNKTNLETAWDGKIDGNLIAPGTYFYSISFADGRSFQGYVSVLY
jgi:gliding motility-associated-like protein